MAIPTSQEVLTAITTIVISVSGSLLAYKKLLTTATKEDKELATVKGEFEVINLLREQISQLSDANRELRVEIESLRQLNKNLIAENEQFKEEIRALKKYIEKHFSKVEEQ